MPPRHISDDNLIIFHKFVQSYRFFQQPFQSLNKANALTSYLTISPQQNPTVEDGIRLFEELARSGMGLRIRYLGPKGFEVIYQVYHKAGLQLPKVELGLYY